MVAAIWETSGEYQAAGRVQLPAPEMELCDLFILCGIRSKIRIESDNPDADLIKIIWDDFSTIPNTVQST